MSNAAPAGERRGAAARVACLGNMNNNLFSVARLLRDRGVEADLLLYANELPHFAPEADSPDGSHAGITRRLRWGDERSFSTVPRADIRRDLEPYGFVIGCGPAPAFLTRAGRVLDLFVPYGSDLYDYPVFRFRPLVNPRYQLHRWRLARAQAAGIAAAAAVHLNNARRKALAVRLGFRGDFLPGPVPMLYAPLYEPESVVRIYRDSPLFLRLEELRRGNDLIVFHHARHAWKTSPDPETCKGNDRLLRGLALFTQRRPDVRACLLTCEYGPDVAESKRLARELGLEGRVHWLPVLPRTDIMAALHAADVGTGDFHFGWFMIGTVAEVLAMGKPLFHYRDDALEEGEGDAYPLVNVREPGEIAAALEEVASRPDAYRRMGEEGRAWFRRRAVDEPIGRYLERIRAAGATR